MKVILGISGSIAAYKAAHLTRLLLKKGAEIQVLMTQSAVDFITPLTLSTLSKRNVLTDVHTDSGWNNHVELGLWADIFVVAPATANTLTKLAYGICDNILSAVYLSARCRVFVAPAMDLDMYQHPSTLAALAILEKHGVGIIPAEHGELASGLVGAGRLAEPEHIVAYLSEYFKSLNDLTDCRLLITAGPTHEALDPVRFLGNRSTGKMGIAIAENAAKRGAIVTLILGPTSLLPNHPNITTIHVESAQQMYEATTAHWPTNDVGILAAAVADYRPETVSKIKIKKNADEDMVLRLVKTPDIAAQVGQSKTDKQWLVGFALETNNEIAHAKAKLSKKNLDCIVLNSLQDAGAGFGHDTNKVTLIFADGRHAEHPLQSKINVASHINDAVAKWFEQQTNSK